MADELKKPPAGLTPRYIWDTERVRAIMDAILRYHEARIAIPDEWMEELKELVAVKPEHPLNGV